MIIKQILNNNAIVSEDEFGKEIIAKGKGIAFKKKVGDHVLDSSVESIFTVKDQSTQRRYSEILSTIPEDIIATSEEIIEYIKSQTDKTINDSIYITLTDHISNLIERINMGIVFDHGLLWDIKRLYSKEYEIGTHVVEMMRSAFHIDIEDDEASFIALHIVNSQVDYNFDGIIKVTGMIEDVYDIVSSDFDLETDKDDLDYNRFIMHLRIFFERIMTNSIRREKDNESVLSTLIDTFPQQYETVLKVIDYINTQFENVYDGEVIYLFLHIIKITK